MVDPLSHLLYIDVAASSHGIWHVLVLWWQHSPGVLVKLLLILLVWVLVLWHDVSSVVLVV